MEFDGYYQNNFEKYIQNCFIKGEVIGRKLSWYRRFS